MEVSSCWLQVFCSANVNQWNHGWRLAACQSVSAVDCVVLSRKAVTLSRITSHWEIKHGGHERLPVLSAMVSLISNAERCSSFDGIEPVHCQDIAEGRLNWLLFAMDNSGWGWWSRTFYELSLHCGFLIILSLGHLVLAGWLVVWAHCLSMIGCLYWCFRSLGPEWG